VGIGSNYIQQGEFIALTNAATHHVDARVDSVGSLLMEGIDVGTTALQEKCTVIASQAADFCWFVLDVIHAAGEGVVLAGYNTTAFVHQVVCHPQKTVCAFVGGICAVADALFIINDLPDQLREHDIPNKEHYYQKIADTEKRLEDLGAAAAQQIKEMKPRDWVKHGTAFVVEGILLHKITQLTISACSSLGPLLGDLLTSLKYEEAVAMYVDGERISFGGLAREVESTTTLMQQAEKAVISPISTVVAEFFAKDTKMLLSLLEKLSEVDPNKVHHILQGHHLWCSVCTDPLNWDAIKEILKQVAQYGCENLYKGKYPSRVLVFGNKEVELVYRRMPDGVLKISNAWVRS
jgi:Bacterial toxin 35